MFFSAQSFAEESLNKYTINANGNVEIIEEHKYSNTHNFKNYTITGTFEDNLGNYGSNDVAVIAEYKNALDAADKALVYFSQKVVAHKRLPNLSKSEVLQAFGAPKNLIIFTNTQELIDNLKENVSPKNTNLLIMSSGNFDGIDWNKTVDQILNV